MNIQKFSTVPIQGVRFQLQSRTQRTSFPVDGTYSAPTEADSLVGPTEATV